MSVPRDPTDPPKWVTDNKDKAKEPFSRADGEREKSSPEQVGKVSETVRRDSPTMAPRPDGTLRTVETGFAYQRVSKEHADVKKEQAAAKIAKNLQKDDDLGNNKDNSRSDDRGR